MKQILNFERICLVLMLLNLLVCNDKNFMKSKHDKFIQEKDKIDKLLNEQKLTNYLRKLMIKNNQLLDKSLIFLDHEDFSNISEDELNYSTMQLNKDDDYEFKARMYAYKWSLLNNKSSMKLIPYSVKKDNSAPHNWKSYLVLLMNSQENILKKICFPSLLHENFAIITKFDKSCSKKVEKFYKFKILDDQEENIDTENKVDLNNIKHEKTSYKIEGKATEDNKSTTNNKLNNSTSNSSNLKTENKQKKNSLEKSQIKIKKTNEKSHSKKHKKEKKLSIEKI